MQFGKLQNKPKVFALQIFCIFSLLAVLIADCAPSLSSAKKQKNIQVQTIQDPIVMVPSIRKRTVKAKKAKQLELASSHKAAEKDFLKTFSFLSKWASFGAKKKESSFLEEQGGGAIGLIPSLSQDLFELPRVLEEKHLSRTMDKLFDESPQKTVQMLPFRIPTENKSFQRIARLHKKKYWSYTRAIFRRMTLYQKEMETIFASFGIPPEIILQAGAETAYQTRLTSPAGAGGIWQFIARTGKKYGMKINQWRDERRNVRKSSIGAATYLRDLYQKFGKWELAIAAYNCGENCIEWVLKRCPNMSFWEIRNRRSCKLPPETSNYVAKIYSLIHFHRSPQLFKKCIKHYPPVQMDAIELTNPISLEQVAKATGLSTKEIWEANPELSFWSTPPGEKFKLLIPTPFGEKLQRYVRAQKSRYRLISQPVRPGEKLAKIASQYGLQLKQLQRFNRIYSNIVSSSVPYLLIPLPRQQKKWKKKQHPLLLSILEEVRNFTQKHRYTRKSRPKGVCHKVRNKDTYKKLSYMYRIPTNWLKRYNRKRPFFVGQYLKLRHWARCPMQRRKKQQPLISSQWSPRTLSAD